MIHSTVLCYGQPVVSSSDFKGSLFGTIIYMDEELHKGKSIPPKLMYHSPACVKDVNSKKKTKLMGVKPHKFD